MPALPATVSKVLALCGELNTSAADLSRVISLDPVLTGKILKLINSAYYGLRQEVVSMTRAIIMLGMNTVKNLALATAILGKVGKLKTRGPVNMDGFWEHSLCVGVASKLIAKRRQTGLQDLEEYFIAGVLHDIGKILLSNIFPDEYLRAMSQSDRECRPLHVSEKEHLGINHTEVGRLIAQNWKLGMEIRDAVACHHSMETCEGKNKDLLITVTLADYFANLREIGFSGNRHPEEVGKELFHYLGITLKDFEEIADEVTVEIEKAQVFLDIARRVS
jgi:putative nucleotidyltransferase with HDIG domain